MLHPTVQYKLERHQWQTIPVPFSESCLSSEQVARRKTTINMVRCLSNVFSSVLNFNIVTTKQNYEIMLIREILAHSKSRSKVDRSKFFRYFWGWVGFNCIFYFYLDFRTPLILKGAFILPGSEQPRFSTSQHVIHVIM